jgi:hypothetical protein
MGEYIDGTDGYVYGTNAKISTYACDDEAWEVLMNEDIRRFDYTYPKPASVAYNGLEPVSALIVS